MSVKQEASGRRSVQTEFEVPGTPEEVWQAIATGPGISAWFVPAEFEERDGRPVAVKYDFGPGSEIRGAVTAWDPPRTYAAQQLEGWGGAPPIATEWNVEARAGGVCVVRVVHSLFASTDEWDDQLEGVDSGWSAFLAILRIYVAHFRGQRSALTQLRNPAAGTDAEIWDALMAALGLQGAAVGQRFAAPAGVPPFRGIVEYVTENPYDALLRVDQPAPGIVALGIAGMPGGPSMVGVNLYLYGDQAAAALAQAEPLWQAWLQQRFPMSAEPGDGE
jgi:uncharacterized protein YndB with AHSA1/START domain